MPTAHAVDRQAALVGVGLPHQGVGVHHTLESALDRHRRHPRWSPRPAISTRRCSPPSSSATPSSAPAWKGRRSEKIAYLRIGVIDGTTQCLPRSLPSPPQLTPRRPHTEPGWRSTDPSVRARRRYVRHSVDRRPASRCATSAGSAWVGQPGRGATTVVVAAQSGSTLSHDSGWAPVLRVRDIRRTQRPGRRSRCTAGRFRRCSAGADAAVRVRYSGVAGAVDRDAVVEVRRVVHPAERRLPATLPHPVVGEHTAGRERLPISPISIGTRRFSLRRSPGSIVTTSRQISPSPLDAWLINAGRR